MEIDPGCQMEVETSITAWKVGIKAKYTIFTCPAASVLLKKNRKSIQVELDKANIETPKQESASCHPFPEI